MLYSQKARYSHLMQREDESRLVYSAEFEAKAREVWKQQIEVISKAHSEHDYENLWTGLGCLAALPNHRLIKLTKEDLEVSIPVLIDVATDMELCPNVQIVEAAMNVIMSFVSKIRYISMPSISVPMERIYNWYKRVGKIARTSKIAWSLSKRPKEFLQKMRLFYSEEDGHRVFEEIESILGRMTKVVGCSSVAKVKEWLNFLSLAILPDVIGILVDVLDQGLGRDRLR